MNSFELIRLRHLAKTSTDTEVLRDALNECLDDIENYIGEPVINPDSSLYRRVLRSKDKMASFGKLKLT